MQGVGAGSIDSASGQGCFRGRGAFGGSNHFPGYPVWSVWVSKDNGSASSRGVAGEPQAGGEDLEAGGVKGTPEAAQEGEVMAP